MNTRIVKSVGWVLLLAAMTAAATGCGRKRQELQITPTYDESLDRGTEGVGTGEGLPEIDVETLSWVPMDLQPVYFDFDRYEIRPDARETLKLHARTMGDQVRSDPQTVFRIEGHCDERGTQLYNMALGERRALATREYLMRLGVPGDRLLTISYGEEYPADPGHNEIAWAKNRRCEFSRARR